MKGSPPPTHPGLENRHNFVDYSPARHVDLGSVHLKAAPELKLSKGEAAGLCTKFTRHYQQHTALHSGLG